MNARPAVLALALVLAGPAPAQEAGLSALLDNPLLKALGVKDPVPASGVYKAKAGAIDVWLHDKTSDRSWVAVLALPSSPNALADCREGICGACSMYINGRPHGPWHANTTCQLHMRAYKDGDTIVVEPWRANAFPVIKDLVVDRSAFGRIIQAGGYISVNTGNAVDAYAMPVEKDKADAAFAAAACIGCGACVAACKNSSALLFVSAKVSHLALLPQGGPERKTRAMGMLAQMDKEGFGSCTNTGACEVECPKGISLENIARMNKEYLKASF